MRWVAFLVLFFILPMVCEAQSFQPPIPTNQKAAAVPNEPYIPYAAPELLSLDISHGPEAGGTLVTLSGKYFTGFYPMTVSFGGSAASNVVVVNHTTLTCTTPAHSASLVNVVVTTRYGSATLVGAYRFQDGPVVASIDPETGTQAGGTEVTITGNHFNNFSPTTVTFDGIAATNVDVRNATTITCDTPAHGLGVVDMVVTNDFGSDTLSGAYTYHDPLVLSSVAPEYGPVAGGTAITLSGSNFSTLGTTTVTFGGSFATSVLVVNSTTITCSTPAHAAGIVDVSVSNDAGSDTLFNAYTYNYPVITVPGDYATIQAAIDAASAGEIILVAPGTYDELLLIPDVAITIRSDADGQSGTEDLAPETTFIDGNQNGPVITFQGGTGGSPTLLGFSVVNGYNDAFDNKAGGIYCEEDSSPTISYNIVFGNACDFGTGGLKTDSSNASQIISYNLICGNVSYFGGSGGMTIGGENAAHTVSGNLIAGNRSVNNSGGMNVTGIDSDQVVVNNIISGNEGVIGGGLALGGWQNNDITITNNTIYDNLATQKGGGLAVGGDLVADLANTILWRNTAPTGAEISMNTAALGSSDLTVTFCDVKGGSGPVHVDPTCTLNWGAGNLNDYPVQNGPTGTWTANGSYSASTYRVTFTDSSASWSTDQHAGSVLIADTSGVQQFYILSNTATTITAWADWDTLDAGSSWIQNGDDYQIMNYHLIAASPCVDTGDNSAAELPAVDFEGDTRIVDGDGDLTATVDIGADEYTP